MLSRTKRAIAGVLVALGAAGLLLARRDDEASKSDRVSAPAKDRMAWAPADDQAGGDRDGSERDGSATEVAPAEGEISVLTLISEMADLAHLARSPSPPFTAKQASSYDRRAKRAEDGESWFANDDFATNRAPNLERVETTSSGERRYVLLDARGPGALVRIWTATPTGTLRIFIDDQSRPALEAPMGSLLAGHVEPFTPPFGQVTAMGHSLYFPFPFRRHCVVTIDSLDSTDPFNGRTVDKVYYQIGYRMYPDSVAERLRAFSAAEVRRARPLLTRVAHALGANRPLEAAADGAARTTIVIAETKVDAEHPSVTVVRAPSTAAMPGERPGPGAAQPGSTPGGALRTLRLVTTERDPERLRATTLTLSFDGEETIHAPLTDFFGTGPGWNPYESLPMTVGTDGVLECRFLMPFRKQAVVTIARDKAKAGEEALTISGSITAEARPFADDTLLLHARFRSSERLATRPLRDWHLATLEGRGQQVGSVLSVQNPPGTSWWGEGDEKIFVDQDTFPSLFGTGTEDYFGYAWSSTERFAHPYHAQTLAPTAGFAGWFSMNRFLVLDPVPFSSRLRFDWELWHWSETSVDMSALLLWYARPGAHDDF